MQEPFDFTELARREPRLLELEAKARSVTDDGDAPFFCSNYVWLPIQAELQHLLGVHRRRLSESEDDEVLDHGRPFEVAYLHLSRLMPPCRDCGCRLFDEVRKQQLGEGAASASSRDDRSRSASSS